jgi:polar amino acid transport system permease protein
MSLDFFLSLFPQLVDGFETTVLLWIFPGILSVLLALAVGAAAASAITPLRWLSTGFITVIRGTPLLVQIYVLYYAVGNLLGQMPGIRGSFLWPFLREGFWYAFAALTISGAAYCGEIFRGAILALPRGEIEAAKALGLARWQQWLLIIIPRAVRVSLPAIGGEMILLLKSTALASTITVMDLLGTANYIRMQTFRVYEPLLAVGLAYVALTLIMVGILRHFEMKAEF